MGGGAPPAGASSPGHNAIAFWFVCLSLHVALGIRDAAEAGVLLSSQGPVPACAVYIFIVQPPGILLNCCVRNESGERLPTSGQKEVASMKQSHLVRYWQQ